MFDVAYSASPSTVVRRELRRLGCFLRLKACKHADKSRSERLISLVSSCNALLAWAVSRVLELPLAIDDEDVEDDFMDEEVEDEDI
jgi:hypothetical protein